MDGNFLKKKTNRNKVSNKLNENNQSKVNDIENLYRKARILYEEKSASFDLDKVDMRDREKKWTAEILKSGTLEDKISSLVLYIKKNPMMCLKYVDYLLKLGKKKNRRQTQACVIALKDLFLEDILKNKKLNSFYNTLQKVKKEEGNLSNISDERLLNFYIDDYVHKKYSEMIEIIGDIIINDPLKAIKKKFLTFLLDMIMKRPEKEEKILEMIVNKLGDPEIEVTNFTISLLKSLQDSHPRMSLVILKNVQNFMSKLPKENEHSKYYAIVFLTRMSIIKDEEFIKYSLLFFFDLFDAYSTREEVGHYSKKKRKEDEINSQKFLSLIVKKINIICKFSSEKGVAIKKLLDEKIDTLFKLSHCDSVKLRIEVLKLIFMISSGVIGKDRSGSEYLDRYYRSLFEILLMKEILFSKALKELLKLIMMSISFDDNIGRVAAFLKRLLQMSLHAEPPFITCTLIIVSQVLRNKHKLWRMMEKNSAVEEGAKYDFAKRDPLYTNADGTLLSELFILRSHYHPTVQRFCSHILELYNKEIIGYDGDPLLDFSLVNFLEKFMLKNPKIKKDKLKFKKETDKEEEELRKFLGEDEEEKEKEAPDTKDHYQLDFIKKFNEIEKVKSVKYEKNQEKKRKKKATENADEDIDEFADKVIEDEYKKYDKDVDEDIDFDDLPEEEFDEDEEGEFEEEIEQGEEDDQYEEDFE